ncbi:hypothetical protein RHSIM_Rhsim03G0004400 [Rhododendron simsii]|uniref:Uncharacterized protein n=1 Tax=Rhododendron simsii TaxID=118357 RepID=A0A834H6W4_RHOSS|nr:hypothetical protein RHSIM_Rhsim03G0004400 [Rhododendron simsii]
MCGFMVEYGAAMLEDVTARIKYVVLFEKNDKVRRRKVLVGGRNVCVSGPKVRVLVRNLGVPGRNIGVPSRFEYMVEILEYLAATLEYLQEGWGRWHEDYLALSFHAPKLLTCTNMALCVVAMARDLLG